MSFLNLALFSIEDPRFIPGWAIYAIRGHQIFSYLEPNMEVQGLAARPRAPQQEMQGVWSFCLALSLNSTCQGAQLEALHGRSLCLFWVLQLRRSPVPKVHGTRFDSESNPAQLQSSAGRDRQATSSAASNCPRGSSFSASMESGPSKHTIHD